MVAGVESESGGVATGDERMLQGWLAAAASALGSAGADCGAGELLRGELAVMRRSELTGGEEAARAGGS